MHSAGALGADRSEDIPARSRGGRPRGSESQHILGRLCSPRQKRSAAGRAFPESNPSRPSNRPFPSELLWCNHGRPSEEAARPVISSSQANRRGRPPGEGNHRTLRNETALNDTQTRHHPPQYPRRTGSKPCPEQVPRGAPQGRLISKNPTCGDAVERGRWHDGISILTHAVSGACDHFGAGRVNNHTEWRHRVRRRRGRGPVTTETLRPLHPPGGVPLRARHADSPSSPSATKSGVPRTLQRGWGCAADGPPFWGADWSGFVGVCPGQV